MSDHTPCQNVDPEIFFARDLDSVMQACDLCAQCPIAAWCLEQGVQTRSSGIWGGARLSDGRIVGQASAFAQQMADAA